MWQHVKLSEQIRDTLACCWDVKQPTNKQSPTTDLEGVQSGPHIQQGELVVTCVHLATIIVVDDVANLPSIAIHNPVMTVERQLIPGAVINKQIINIDMTFV